MPQRVGVVQIRPGIRPTIDGGRGTGRDQPHVRVDYLHIAATRTGSGAEF